jgi:hypothetical protein
MKRIKAKDLLKLGFKRQNDVDFGDKFHYYTFEVNGKGILISNSNDEKVKGGYTIELYDVEEIKFKSLRTLKALIKALKQRK